MERDSEADNGKEEGSLTGPDSKQDPLRRAMAALGEEHRFHLAELMRARPRSVGELVDATGLPQPLVSHHLAVLCQAEVARAERSGRRRLYRLAQPENPLVRALVNLIGKGAAHPPEPEDGQPGVDGEPDLSDQNQADPVGSPSSDEGIEDYLL